MLRLIFCLIIRRHQNWTQGVEYINMKNVIIRHIKKTLRKREFWFTILLYPAIAAGYFYLKNNEALYQLVKRTGIWYFVISLILFLYITVIVTFENIEKRLMHKVQGNKLKIKQDEWRHK